MGFISFYGGKMAIGISIQKSQYFTLVHANPPFSLSIEVVYQPHPLYPLPLEKGKGKIFSKEGLCPS